MDLFEAIEQLRETGLVAGLDGGLPLGEKRVGDELVFPVENAADAAHGLPLDDHEHGQDIEDDVRARQERGQGREGQDDRLAGQDKNVTGPLPLEEKEQSRPDGPVVVTPRVEDAERALARPPAALEGLFLQKGAGAEAGDLFLGRLPDRPRLREVRRQRAERLGATIVSYQSYKFPGEREFRPFLTRVKEANPDLLFACGYYNEGALVTRQAKELGLNVQIVGTEGMDSPKFLELAGPAAEGLVIVTTLNRDDPRPHVQSFLKAYRQAYTIDADMVGASSYDALKILAAAIDKVGTDPKAITKFIAESPGFDTLTGPVRRFVKGEPIKPVQVQAVREGKFRYHSVIDTPEVITPPTQ